MENHLSKLDEICRVSSGKIKFSEGYRHAKALTDYMDMFPWANDEDPNVYPRKVCNSCKKKLDRQRKGQSAKLEFALFFEHIDSNCSVCAPVKTGRGHESKLHAKVLDKAFLNINFIKYPADGDKIYFRPDSQATSFITVSITIKITNEGFWTLFVNNDIQIEKSSPYFSNLPVFLSDTNIDFFCSEISKLSVCEGVKDFDDVVKSRIDFRNPFPGSQSEAAAFVESDKSKTKFLKENFSVIRSANCSYLTNNKKICQNCTSYRKSLTIYRGRISDMDPASRTSDDSHTNFRYLQIEEKDTRLRNLAKAKHNAVQKAAVYSLKIDKILKKDGVFLPSDENKLLSGIISSNSVTFEEGTPQSLLWQQQLEQAGKRNVRSMRWHPLIVRWCLSIYHASPAAYRQISSKRNNFLVLPHINTLKKYLNSRLKAHLDKSRDKSLSNRVSKFQTSYRLWCQFIQERLEKVYNILIMIADVIECLVEDSNIDELEEFQTNVSLMYDEIKIKSGLAYKRSNGQLIGHFINFC